MTNNEKDLSDKSVSMDREIKFRAWDNVWLFMTAGVTIGDIEEGFKGLHYGDPNVYIMQYTGLKDKNGVGIYEGDIVKRDDESNGKYRRFAVVEIKPDIQFNCRYISSIDGIQNSTDRIFRYGSFIYTDTHNHLEVIGNIYQNPELLSDI